MTLDVADIMAAVILNALGTGLLGNYMLQRDRADHETKLEHLKKTFEGELRGLQTVLDRAVLVHRAHFETEFEALRDIWMKLAAVRASMGLVRLTMDLRPADETDEQRERREFERFKRFSTDLTALIRAVDSQSPFVPRDIYHALEKAIEVAQKEATEVEVERPDRDRNPMRDWFKRGKEHFREFRAAVGEVSDLIRARLEALTLVPGDR